MRKNILVYNNCSNIAEMLSHFCAGEEIYVRKLGTRREIEAVQWANVDLILLDIFMDEGHWAEGIRLVRDIREKSRLPIIVVSAQELETVKIMALNAGADDFVSAKANPLEIFARVKASLRRYTQMTDVCHNAGKLLSVEGLSLHDKGRMVTVDGRQVALTPTEYKILKFLIGERGKVFSGGEIYQAVWKMNPVGVENTIAVHIRHIREKIEENPANPHYLKVVWGRGYIVG